jgi:general secretion pathway protein M
MANQEREMKLNEIRDALSEAVTSFWNVRNERERSILIFGAAALVLFLLYAIFFAPALNGRTVLNRDLPAMRQQLAEMQSLAKEVGELAGATAPDPEPVSQENIAASLSSHGLKPQSLTVNGELVRLQINPVAYSSLMDWLDEQQKTARLTVMEANFIVLPQSDSVNASLTLRQQRSGE